MNDREFLDLALQQRLINRKQYDNVSGELASNPSLDAATALLRRFYLTQPQIDQLQSMLPAGGGGDMRGFAHEEPDTEKEALEAPPSIAELQARRAAAAEQRAGAPAPRPPAQRQPAPSQPAPAQPRPATQQPAPSRPVSAPPAPKPAPRVEVAAPPPGGQPKKLVDMLRLARHWGCSDFHVTVDRAPFVRLGGEIRYMEMPPVDAALAEELNFSLLDEHQSGRARRDLNLDFALEIPGSGRYRCNIFHQRLGWDGSYRIIPPVPPTCDELGLPQVLRGLMDYNQGLVLVTGGAGSGKTTTVAALIDHVNKHRDDHIITVEDPIEYVHRPHGCQITQREVRNHTESFGIALRAALREDPDIILVGELRDLDTVSISIRAAETGHLVLGTLHTGSTARTVGRILDVFPPAQQDQIRTMVAESMRGVISQQLVPRLDGQGRVLALEIMIVTSAISSLIKEGKTHQIGSTIQSSRKIGMQLMDDALLELVRSNTIAGAEGYARAENKAAFEAYKGS